MSVIAFFVACINVQISHAESDGAYSIPAELAIHSLLTDAAQVGSLMVVVGERGHILSSRDNGLTWRQARVPTRVLLTGVHMFDEQLGWAVGLDATIVRTLDGGLTWQLQYSDPDNQEPLLDVWFKDDKTGLALGAYGLFLTTQDGGEQWQPQRLSEDDDFHLNKMLALESGQWLIAAEAGMIYRSGDQAETWEALDSPYHGSFFGGLALGGSRTWLFGLRGHAFYSDDAGDSWTIVETGTQVMLTSALKSQAGDCYLGGLGGVLLINKGCDGQDFEIQQFEGRKGISALLESNGVILLVGEAGIQRWVP